MRERSFSTTSAVARWAHLFLLGFNLNNAPTNLNADTGIHAKDVGCRASDRSEPDNESAVLKMKMLIPDVRTRIEKPRQFVSVWVNAGKVRSLLVITQVTSEREIHQVLRSPMLSRHNVFDMKSEIWVVALANSTIFTSIVSPLTNALFRCIIHHAF